MLYDNETEGIFAVAVASKATKPWIVEFVKNILYELGYGQLKIAIKCDGAKELQELRRAVANSRESPTVPIDVPARESKANGGMERAVRTWAGQFRTLKSHFEYETKIAIPLHHPLLQWMAWWAAGIYNRFAVRHHGRTAHEYGTGHKTKLPVACFGETVLWRKKRTTAELNKHDVEYSEGVFLGMSGMGSELVIGTPGGVVRTRDIRVLSDEKARWNGAFALRVETHVEQYVDPSEELPDKIGIEPGIIAHDTLPPEVEVAVNTRRMRLSPSDFLTHGYTAGCPGCINLRRKSPQSKNHSEACRLRMESCLGATYEGRARKECEAGRKDEELTAALRAEDAKIQAEKDIADKTATDAAISAGSSSHILQGERVNTSNTNAGPAMAEDVPVPSTPEPIRYFPMTPDAAMEPESPIGQMSTEMCATDDFVMS